MLDLFEAFAMQGARAARCLWFAKPSFISKLVVITYDWSGSVPAGIGLRLIRPRNWSDVTTQSDLSPAPASLRQNTIPHPNKLGRVLLTIHLTSRQKRSRQSQTLAYCIVTPEFLKYRKQFGDETVGDKTCVNFRRNALFMSLILNVW